MTRTSCYCPAVEHAEIYILLCLNMATVSIKYAYSFTKLHTDGVYTDGVFTLHDSVYKAQMVCTRVITGRDVSVVSPILCGCRW